MNAHGSDELWLEVKGVVVDVLTGIYSEETHLPQPLRIDVSVRMTPPPHYAPDTPLTASKNYMDLKFAATEALKAGGHFVLIESVAQHIVGSLFLQDARIDTVVVKIVKLAIAEQAEEIGITLRRHRAQWSGQL